MPIYMKYDSVPGARTSKLSKVHSMSSGLETVSFRGLVSAFYGGVISPRDPATGQATGKRQHQPITIVKELDKSDVVVSHLVRSGRIIPKLYLTFYKTPSPTGHPLLSMNLSDVEVSVGRASEAGGSAKHIKSVNTMELERIKLTFQKIEITLNSGGVTATDDWEART